MKSKPHQPRKSARVPKTIEQRVSELEYHSHEVRRCLGSLRHSAENLRTLAAELRVLLCLSSRTEGLLWRALDDLNLDDSVFIHPPVRINHSHPLASKILLYFVPLVRTDIWAPTQPVATQSYRKVIKEYEVAYADGIPITHEQLIRKVAEQTGTGHESDDVEIALLELYGTTIDNVQVPLEILRTDAWLAVELSERVLEHWTNARKLQRRTLSPNDGELSFVVGVGFTELPVSEHTVFISRSDVFRTEISGAIGPNGFRFRIAKPGITLVDVLLPLTVHEDGKDLQLFAFSYSSSLRKYRWLTPQSSCEPTNLNLGWLDAGAFAIRTAGVKIGSNVSFRLTLLSGALLSQSQVKEMYDAPPGTFGVLEDTAVAQARGGFP